MVVGSVRKHKDAVSIETTIIYDTGAEFDAIDDRLVGILYEHDDKQVVNIDESNVRYICFDGQELITYGDAYAEVTMKSSASTNTRKKKTKKSLEDMTVFGKFAIVKPFMPEPVIVFGTSMMYGICAQRDSNISINPNKERVSIGQTIRLAMKMRMTTNVVRMVIRQSSITAILEKENDIGTTSAVDSTDDDEDAD